VDPLQVFTTIADDLYAFREWEIGEYSGYDEMNQRVWRRYPGF
jgi:hypothetical protein